MIQAFLECATNNINNASKGNIENATATNEDFVIKILADVKQFISGLKNYLLKTGEGSFLKFVDEERRKVERSPIILIFHVESTM